MHYEFQRAYVEFNQNFTNLHTKISCEVYMAVWMSRLRNRDAAPLTLQRVVDNEHNRIILMTINRERSRNEVDRVTSRNQVLIESAGDALNDPAALLGNSTEFKIRVTEVDGFGHFWAQVAEPRFEERLAMIQNELDMQTTRLVAVKSSDVFVGKIVATLFYDPDLGEYKFYRARIERIIDSSSVRVYYIDYGNYENNKDIQLIFELPNSLKKTVHQAFECKLAKVRLVHMVAENNVRSEKATKEFTNLLANCIDNLRASVYSIVDGVVNVDLFDLSSDLVEVSIAACLIKLELCERCQESPQSMVINV